MSSSRVPRLLHRWRVHKPLNFLTQGSTLSIRSKVQADVRIRSQWRDDGELSFLEQRAASNPLGHVVLSKHEDKMTSLGQKAPHMSIDLLEPSEAKEWIERNDAICLPLPDATTILDNDENDDEQSVLTLDVPDKINIDCDLTKGGSISVESKIEGDVLLKTAQGNITVQKLRGHHIELETGSSGENAFEEDDSSVTPSYIFVSDVLESQSLKMAVKQPSVDRIRAKRIHAKTMEIVAEDHGNTSPIVSDPLLFDDDDEGATIDIGSLYIIGDATIDIQQTNATQGRQPQAVRIKSHHGHVHVQASAPQPDSFNEMTQNRKPLVDLGGVNGSCEVFVSTTENQENWTSCHVHFDSIAPDSVSLLHAETGNVHVTVDRKVESDVRLLSPPAGTCVDTDILLLEDNEDGSLADEVNHMLQEMEDPSAHGKRIEVQTQAFTRRDHPTAGWKNVEFVDGWIENTTSEPDSRFDRKIRGTTDGGKIRLDGAQNQALHGFVADRGESTFARPLLAVSTPGRIVLETLSWLGNIARRYGLDETRKTEDLGRQATRRKGLGRVVPENE